MDLIERYLDDIINGPGGFKVWEDREFVVHKNRDQAIAAWVIRCLANPESEGSGTVMLNIIKQRRKRLDKQNDTCPHCGNDVYYFDAESYCFKCKTNV